ncbi:MAG: shikimate kinase [Bacteroidales bacterium]|nr:shikimate kinase [Bacteroidales bacterium]
MRIILVGFMGAGKTSIGKRLAKTMGLSFYDLDSEIESKYKTTINSIFEKFGEYCFRQLETETLKSFGDKDDFVLSCGGGTPCFNNNMDYIKNLGISVYIKLPAKALVNRIANSHKKRPLTSSKSESELEEYIEKALGERENYYSQAAITVSGVDFDKSEAVSKIMSCLPQ